MALRDWARREADYSTTIAGSFPARAMSRSMAFASRTATVADAPGSVSS
jgi:hypothetical protein